MLSLRSSFVAVVAGSLLLAGPAQAARTQPVNRKTDPPATARRSAPAGKKAARRHSAPLTGATPPAGALSQPVAPVAAAPQLVSLSGRVFDAQGRPRPGVCVFPTSDTHLIAVTDAQGSFRLQVPAQPDLSLQAEYVGVGSTRVMVNSHTAQPVHIVLGR